MKLDVMSFIRRFLQHVLPQGFQKVRYSGFLHPSAKTRFTAIKELLQQHPDESTDTLEHKNAETQNTSSNRHTPDAPGICPHCGGPLRYLGRVPRCSSIDTPEKQQRRPP